MFKTQVSFFVVVRVTFQEVFCGQMSYTIALSVANHSGENHDSGIIAIESSFRVCTLQ